MALVLAILAFAVILGVRVHRVGLKVYASMFVFAMVASLMFVLLYFRLFF